MSDVVETVTLESLRDALHELGFRAQIVGDVQGVSFIRSAVSGMAFDVRLGSPAIGSETEAIDFRLVAAIQVEGDLDLELVSDWNNVRRFGRLHLDRSALLLDMDVSVAGGVRRRFLLGQIETWSRLVGTLLDHMRQGLTPAAADAGRGARAQATA